MRHFQGYIFDLDGMIYLGEQAIPGAPETVRCLRRAGCRVTFVSNKPLQPRERYDVLESMAGKCNPLSRAR